VIKFERIWKLIPADWLLSFSLCVSPEKLYELPGSLTCSPKASPSNCASVTGRKFPMSQFSVFSGLIVSPVPSEAIFFLKTHHLPVSLPGACWDFSGKSRNTADLSSIFRVQYMCRNGCHWIVFFLLFQFTQFLPPYVLVNFQGLKVNFRL